MSLALDAVKRRTLPAWIREGLEKMDREKQKKLERERMEKEHESMVKDDSINNRGGEEGDGPFLPRKSKFVSTQFLDAKRSRLTLRAVPSIRTADVFTMEH